MGLRNDIAISGHDSESAIALRVLSGHQPPAPPASRVPCLPAHASPRGRPLATAPRAVSLLTMARSSTLRSWRPGRERAAEPAGRAPALTVRVMVVTNCVWLVVKPQARSVGPA